MYKILASLVIVGLCANICLALAPTASSNSGAFSSSVLNSSATKVISGTNATDSAVWDSSTAAVTGGASATSAGVENSYTWFGPGTTNDTSYVFGIQYASITSATATGSNPGVSTPTINTISGLRKRTINNTIVGWANDTTEASVVGDTSVSTSFMGLPTGAVGPGYLALLSTSYDSTTASAVNQQVYLTLVTASSGSATTSKLTSTADVAVGVATTTGCTATTYGLGNIWYDIGAGAFFYTYWKNVVTQTAPGAGSTACTSSTSSQATSIYLGGVYVNGTAYWTSPIMAAAGGTAGDTITSLIAGGDNWLNSSNIYIVYRDTTATTVYYSKTTKSASTTAVGSFSSLIKDPAAVTGPPAVTMTYSPVSVWASNYTYGITVSNTTSSTPSGGSAALTYTYVNFINGSTSGVDSGLSNSAASGTGSYWGWQLNTGYSIVATWRTGTAVPYATSYTAATYYGNGTANMTATTLGSTTYAAGAQFYEDVNGTMWIGWTDADYANSPVYTYNAYLAKFQGQLNVPSGATVLSALSVFALFLVSIFAF